MDLNFDKDDLKSNVCRFKKVRKFFNCSILKDLLFFFSSLATITSLAFSILSFTKIKIVADNFLSSDLIGITYLEPNWLCDFNEEYLNNDVVYSSICSVYDGLICVNKDLDNNNRFVKLLPSNGSYTTKNDFQIKGCTTSLIEFNNYVFFGVYSSEYNGIYALAHNFEEIIIDNYQNNSKEEFFVEPLIMFGNLYFLSNSSLYEISYSKENSIFKCTRYIIEKGNFKFNFEQGTSMVSKVFNQRKYIFIVTSTSKDMGLLVARYNIDEHKLVDYYIVNYKKTSGEFLNKLNSMSVLSPTDITIATNKRIVTIDLVKNDFGILYSINTQSDNCINGYTCIDRTYYISLDRSIIRYTKQTNKYCRYPMINPSKPLLSNYNNSIIIVDNDAINIFRHDTFSEFKPNKIGDGRYYNKFHPNVKQRVFNGNTPILIDGYIYVLGNKIIAKYNN